MIGIEQATPILLFLLAGYCGSGGLLGKRIGEASNPGPIKAKKRQAPNSAELQPAVDKKSRVTLSGEEKFAFGTCLTKKVNVMGLDALQDSTASNAEYKKHRATSAESLCDSLATSLRPRCPPIEGLQNELRISLSTPIKTVRRPTTKSAEEVWTTMQSTSRDVGQLIEVFVVSRCHLLGQRTDTPEVGQMRGGVAHIVRTFCRQLLLSNHRLTVAILWNGKLNVELAARQMHEVHTDEKKRHSISVETTRFVLMDCTAVTAGQSLNTKLATLYNVGLVTLAEYPNASLWVNFDASDLASALDIAVRSIAGASEATRLHGAAFYLCNSLDFYFDESNGKWVWLSNAAHAENATANTPVQKRQAHRIATVSSTMVISAPVVDFLVRHRLGSRTKYPDPRAAGEDLWLRETLAAIGVSGVLVGTDASTPKSLQAALKLTKPQTEDDPAARKVYADQGIKSAVLLGTWHCQRVAGCSGDTWPLESVQAFFKGYYITAAQIPVECKLVDAPTSFDLDVKALPLKAVMHAMKSVLAHSCLPASARRKRQIDEKSLVQLQKPNSTSTSTSTSTSIVTVTAAQKHAQVAPDLVASISTTQSGVGLHHLRAEMMKVATTMQRIKRMLYPLTKLQAKMRTWLKGFNQQPSGLEVDVLTRKKVKLRQSRGSFLTWLQNIIASVRDPCQETTWAVATVALTSDSMSSPPAGLDENGQKKVCFGGLLGLVGVIQYETGTVLDGGGDDEMPIEAKCTFWPLYRLTKDAATLCLRDAKSRSRGYAQDKGTAAHRTDTIAVSDLLDSAATVCDHDHAYISMNTQCAPILDQVDNGRWHSVFGMTTASAAIRSSADAVTLSRAEVLQAFNRQRRVMDMDGTMATTMSLLQRPGVDLKCKFATYSPAARTAHLPTIAREICNDQTKASMLVQESTRLYCHPRSGLLAASVKHAKSAARINATTPARLLMLPVNINVSKPQENKQMACVSSGHYELEITPSSTGSLDSRSMVSRLTSNRFSTDPLPRILAVYPPSTASEYYLVKPLLPLKPASRPKKDKRVSVTQSEGQWQTVPGRRRRVIVQYQSLAVFKPGPSPTARHRFTRNKRLPVNVSLADETNIRVPIEMSLEQLGQAEVLDQQIKLLGKGVKTRPPSSTLPKTQVREVMRMFLRGENKNTIQWPQVRPAFLTVDILARGALFTTSVFSTTFFPKLSDAILQTYTAPVTEAALSNHDKVLVNIGKTGAYAPDSEIVEDDEDIEDESGADDMDEEEDSEEGDDHDERKDGAALPVQPRTLSTMMKLFNEVVANLNMASKAVDTQVTPLAQVRAISLTATQWQSVGQSICDLLNRGPDGMTPWAADSHLGRFSRLHWHLSLLSQLSRTQRRLELCILALAFQAYDITARIAAWLLQDRKIEGTTRRTR